MTHTRRAVAPLLAVGILLSGGCSAIDSLPGVGDSAFEEALEVTPSGEEPLVLFFSDAERIREEMGPGGDGDLMYVGAPEYLTGSGPSRDGVEDLVTAYTDDAVWGMRTRQDLNRVEVVEGPVAPGVRDYLEAQGWTSEDDATWTGPAGSGRGARASVGDERASFVVDRTGDPDAVLGDVGSGGLAESPRLAPLLDCIGDDPLAVSFISRSTPDAGVAAYAVVTDLADDTLQHRSCVLADGSTDTARELMEGTADSRVVRAEDVQVDGQVLSADLTFVDGKGGDGAGYRLHQQVVESPPPGW